MLSTASYLPEATRGALERLLAMPIVEFYGLCEAGMMTAPALSPEMARPGAVGRIPEGELAIRDDKGVFLRPGQTGQVMLRGPSVMPGYLFDDIDGVPSGLRGWLAADRRPRHASTRSGFLTIVGRTKEIINRGGEKISPYDVEKALLGHPAVREAAAFAVPHPRLGENVGAAVVLHPDGQATSTAAHRFHLRSSGAFPDAAARPYPGKPAGGCDRQDLAPRAVGCFRRPSAHHASGRRHRWRS